MPMHSLMDEGFDPDADADERLTLHALIAWALTDGGGVRLVDILDGNVRSRPVVLPLEELRRLARLERDRPSPG